MVHLTVEQKRIVEEVMWNTTCLGSDFISAGVYYQLHSIFSPAKMQRLIDAEVRFDFNERGQVYIFGDE